MHHPCHSEEGSGENRVHIVEGDKKTVCRNSGEELHDETVGSLVKFGTGHVRTSGTEQV